MQESQPQQTKTQRYADIHILNSTGNILLVVQEERLVLNEQSGQWECASISEGARVMINDAMRIHPQTLKRVDADDPSGVPGRSLILQRFAAQWADIGEFAEQFLQTNGDM